MSKIENVSKVSSMINNVFTTLTTIFTTFGVSIYFFKDYIFEILSAIEFLIILGLLYLLNKGSKIKPNTSNVANTELFKRFFDKELELCTKNIDQLNDGYLEVYSDQVREIQSSCIDYIKNTNNSYIHTLDLTSNPSLWLTRTKYINANKKFIEDGGIIKRVLIIDEQKLENKDFADSLYELIELFLDIGVQVGLQFECFLKQEELKDFIIYGDFAVLVEGKQADKDYKKASSILQFKNNNLDTNTKLFESVWKSNNFSVSSLDMLKYFKKYYNRNEKISFESFLEENKEVFNDYIR